MFGGGLGDEAGEEEAWRDPWPSADIDVAVNVPCGAPFTSAGLAISTSVRSDRRKLGARLLPSVVPMAPRAKPNRGDLLEPVVEAGF